MSIRNQVMGAAGAASGSVNYIEDVFSTYLYTGNGSTQTINNGIDLAGKGGLVLQKVRTDSGSAIQAFDTNRGAYKRLVIAFTNPEYDWSPYGVSAFNGNGFTIADNSGGDYGANGPPGGLYSGNGTYASWTFRKQPKFFDVVTYTGNGVANRAIAHSLGSAPGCVIVKQTSGATGWCIWHRGLTAGNILFFDTSAQSASTLFPTDPTSTSFNVNGSLGNGTNGNGLTYVAYLFAHNAGGFGATGTDNVVSCGSFTTDAGGNATVNLGYEPQWVLIKRSDSTGNWLLMDSMRGMPVTANSTTTTGGRLYPNLSAADDGYPSVIANATGFITVPGTVPASATFIYIAIRRGPMKVPTDGTKVFSPNQTSATTGTAITTGFPVDWQLLGINDGNVYNQRSSTRLTGVNTDGTSNSQYLVTSNTNAEAATGSVTLNWGSTGFQVPPLNSGSPTIFWNFRRAPGFFDEVCYTGTGYTEVQNLQHNLKAVPEMMIVKGRSYAGDSWIVYHSAIGNTKYLQLNSASNSSTATLWNDTTPTSSVFTVGNNTATNMSAATYVAYLFASCPGVSKVGSYTGNGTTQTIPCGFAAGARFVLIKRTDSTGDWYVWDSARGIVAGNDPHLSLNTTAAEVTTNDSVDPVSTGFIVNQVAATNVNVSGATYIFLAIA